MADAARRARILVCDDAKTIRALIESLLSAEYELKTVASAEEALSVAEAFAPDLFISDLLMEGMNGYELCQRVRQVPALAHVPFVLLTSKTDEESRATGLEVGADDYLFKPLRPRELIARVRSLLRLRFANQQLERQKAELERLALQDGLTGLYNHRCFQERLREEVGRAQRYGRPLTLVFIDIDHFKQLNDRFGHLTGDEALKAMGALLSGSEESNANKRTSDIAARYGGEELMLLLPETDREGGMVKANRVCDAAPRVKLSAEGAVFTVSCGVAEFPRDASTAQELIQRADEAMYHAKRTGRNRAVAQGSFSTGEGAPSRSEPLRSYRDVTRETAELLRRERYLSAYYVDLGGLFLVEKEYGSDTFLETMRNLIDAMMADPSKLLTTKDLVTTGHPGRVGLVIFPDRATATGMPPDAASLERFAMELSRLVESAVTTSMSHLVPSRARIAVGFAVGIDTRHYSHDRQVELLVRDAMQSAQSFRTKRNEREKIELQLILLNDGLHSVYQPIVTQDGAEIIGYEALVRGPDHTALALPHDLLQAAARADLEWELDRGCLRSAFLHAGQLPDKALLSVNVLPSTFYDRDFGIDGLRQLIDRAGLSPERVILEVTEQSVISNLTRFREALAPLRKAGIKIALDDVGVANANLEQVGALLPDYLKLDRVLVEGIAKSKPRLELIRSIVALAVSLRAKVIAEGVETREDWECLRDVGVDYLQGFYFARPAPPFTTKLKA